MKISTDVIKFQFRVLRISREWVALFGLFTLAAVFMAFLGFVWLTILRNQRLLNEQPEAELERRIEFREDRLKKALEIINAREK